MKTRLFLLLLLLNAALCIKCADTYGQERDTDTTGITQSIRAGNQYMDARITSLDQYVQHYAHIQKRLVKKLNKRERNLSGLHATPGELPDTAYHRNGLTSDSLLTLAKDPSLFYNKGSPKKNALIDSLKNIQHFIQNQSSKLQNTSTFTSKSGLPTDYSTKLATLQQKLNAQQQLSSLIKQKVSSLQSQAGGNKLSGLSSIQKDVAIAESKIQYWKQATGKPDATEEKAYEYLQGTKGFESYLNSDKKNAFGGLGNNASVADLQNMGYQTKGMVSDALNKKFGSNLAAVQKQMGAQIAKYQKQLNEIQSKAKEIENGYRQGKQQLAAAKDQLRHIEKPAFKNPMRGIPFWKRFKTRYNFQTTKATSDGNPALLDLGASLAFEQTPKWRWGIGAGASIGLGKDWQHLKLSYEGISFRAFLDRAVIYGIALEGGYERRFQPVGRVYQQQTQISQSQEQPATIFNKAFGVQQQSAYLGLVKSYHINKKWNGTFLIGYDFLWQQYGRRSPLLIRFGWENN